VTSKADMFRDDFMIKADNLQKRFGSIVALRGASLAVRRGTIHALVGENGAGKSTALGAIAGRLHVDSGSITIAGQDTTRATPRAVHAMGLAAIYQELTIVPAMTACENLFFGHTPVRGGFMRRSAMRTRHLDLCARVGVSIPPEVRAGNLSVADQQMLEIMRALESRARIILFDEPTASLVDTERETLFRIMRELRADGVTMVIVSHNLNEVLAISDEITVFRNGETVATAPAASWTRVTLLVAMLGEAATDLVASHRSGKPADPRTQPVINISNLTVPGILEDISIKSRPGEVLGIAGLVGSGRTTLLRAIAGLEPTAHGRMVVDGTEVRWPTTPRRARDLNIALVPEDRKGQGLLLLMSICENLAISNLRAYSRLGFVHRRRLGRETGEVARLFALDPSRLDQPVRNLSGGNQQKVLLARWHLASPRVLLADEPTRGIDVGAKAAILDCLRDFANAGATVIVVSSELEELTALSDRVVVLAHGRLVEELQANASGVPADRMLSAAFAE
jgi:ABC-type sugar transport system ATPase subunit